MLLSHFVVPHASPGHGIWRALDLTALFVATGRAAGPFVGTVLRGTEVLLAAVRQEDGPTHLQSATHDLRIRSHTAPEVWHVCLMHSSRQLMARLPWAAIVGNENCIATT